MNTQLQTTGTVHHSNILGGPSDAAAVVTGQFPEWLVGDVVRTAPAVYARGGWAAQHWFDALGMFYSFSIQGPTRASFKQRINGGDYNRAALAGHAPYASFGTPNQRGAVRRIFEPIPVSTDNANVNIVSMGKELVAMTETSRQLAVSFGSLETRGHVAYDDDLPAGTAMTAHPLFDVDRNLVVNVGTIAGPTPQVVFYGHRPDERRRRIFGRVRLARLPYIHAFGLSPGKAVLIANPFDVSPRDLLWSNRFVDHYRWRPEQGTTLHVVDRWSGEVQAFTTDSMFVFHVINTYDEARATIIDVLAYPDARVLTGEMRTSAMSERLPDLRPIPTRLRLSHDDGRVTVVRLASDGFEFPSISYRRHAGRPYRFAWGAANEPVGRGARSRIVKTDVSTGEQTHFEDPGYVFGEPLYVAPRDASREDEGVLLSVGTDPATSRTKLVALRADRLDLAAEATVEVPVPLGYHGTFVRSAGGET